MTVVAVLYCDPKGPYPGLNRRLVQEERLARETRVRAHGGSLGWDSCMPEALIDCWDESRDARLYDGPHPVVAHPPCKHWGRLAHLAKGWCPICNVATVGIGDNADDTERACEECGNELTTDADCAPRAVEQVRRWGGVLEHPAGSKLWEACRLTPPMLIPGLFGGSATDYAPLGSCASISSTDAHGGFTVEADQCEWGHVARKRTWLYLVGVPREVLEAPPFPGREPTHYASGGRTPTSRSGGAVPTGVKVCSAQQRRRTPPLFAEMLIRLARAAGSNRSVRNTPEHCHAAALGKGAVAE